MKTVATLFIVLFSCCSLGQMKACDWFKLKQKVAFTKMNDYFGEDFVAEKFEIDTTGYLIDYGREHFTYQDTNTIDTSKYHALQFPFWFKISDGTSRYKFSGVLCDYDLDGGFDFEDDDICAHLRKHHEQLPKYAQLNALISEHFKHRRDELEFYFNVRMIENEERFLLNIGWPTIYASSFRPCAYKTQKSIEIDALTGKVLQVRQPKEGHTY